MANTNFKNAMMLVLKHEGGFQADKRDTGNSDDGHGNQGSTMLGVTAKVWANYTGAPAPIDIMKGLTHEMVLPLYKTEYWDRVKGDALHPALALCIFDFGVNAGTGRAAKFIQKIVGTTVDGGIGPNSLKMIDAYVDKHGIEDVVKTYQSDRQEYYEKLKHFKTFGRGWTRRVTETTEEALKLT